MPSSSVGRRYLGAVVICLTLGVFPACRPITGVGEFTPFVSMEATDSQVSSGDWPSWRGPEGTGAAAAETPRPLGQSPLLTLWRQPLAGTGNSSPVTAGDRIWLTSELAREEGALLLLHCFDRATGEPLWEIPVAEVQAPTHRKNGFASATPVTDGNRVFVHLAGRGLYCFDRAGDRLWHAPVAETEHEWGFAGSPLLEGGRVIVVCDGERESSLSAYSAATGDRLWSTPRESRGSWCSPVALTAVTEEGTERREVIVNGTSSWAGRAAGWVIAYHPATGRELWRCQGTSDIPCPTAILGVCGGEPWVVSSSGGNGPIFAIRPGGRGDVTEQRVPWRLPVGGPYVPTGVMLPDRLFLLADGGYLRSLDPRTGGEQWKHRLHGSFSASLLVVGEQLVALSEQGDLYVCGAGERYELHAVTRLREHCTATPARVPEGLLVRTAESLLLLAPGDELTQRPEISPAPAASPSDRPAALEPSDSV